MRSAAWANFDRSWPPLNEQTFGQVDGWLRLGDVPDDQTDFWKAVRLAKDGTYFLGVTRGWRRVSREGRRR